MTNRDVWVSEIWREIKTSRLLDAEDTALIFYSVVRLRERLHGLREIFGAGPGFPPVLHTVAVKTNPQRHILRQIVQSGFGLEAASFEEVKLAVEAGASFDRITYNSPVKTKHEIAWCEENYSGLRLNVNSLDELDRLSSHTSLHVGIRVNPLVHAGSDELYNVSGEESKFGVPIDQRDAIIDHALRYPVDTLHLHVGSQVGDLAKVAGAIADVVDLADSINRNGAEKGRINTINIGGGLPAGRDPHSSLQLMREYVELIQGYAPRLRQYQVITEFGQWVHKHNGVTFSQVEYVKKLARKYIAYVHVGADLFMREAYTAMNTLDFVALTDAGVLLEREESLIDIAGPLCFNGDYLGKDRRLPRLEPGDIIAIPSSGANSYGLWSRHCSRTVPAIFTDGAVEGGIVKIADRLSLL